MQISFTEKKNIRKSFGKLKESLSIPNLIEVQKKSYNQFLYPTGLTDSSLQKGLDKVFNSIFPIEELSDKATLEYLSFRLEKPKFDVEECRQRDLTYASPLKPTLRLVIYDIDETIAHIKGLSSIGIIKKNELAKLIKSLKELRLKFLSGKFKLTEKYEDCHSAIEFYLTKV